MPWMQPKERVASVAARHNAPELRRSLTEPEKRLWMLLRKRLPQAGTHFRRQVPLGPYIADFVCFGAKLIIEVDGDQHGFKTALRYDARRSTWLETQGFNVLRFTNRQIMTEAEMVLDTIFAALSGQAESCPTPPTPGPSPQGGGESRGSLHE
ncbi:endonuclease domain-containing protein [Bosea sp. F3-2]|uniref:endonuclease domain-containing protein n=1 Tax=Bosea sp. F3-2 TaxID=2599640 RepID=UPI0011EF0CA2|nr:endonuclease domain-containing protein [Bosea sp. F3-2]QEL21689.1 endonuclease domain-containing protein [Bosea sp. F3-2]